MKKLLAIFFCLFAAPALAQWQVPNNSIPIGKGAGKSGFGSIITTGTGSLCLLNAAPPAFGTCPPPTFTQTGTGAVLQTYDSFYRQRIFTPEQFGGACDGTDAGPAIQRAITQAATVLGRVTLAPCNYTVVTPIVTTTGIEVEGTSGRYGTTIIFAPIVDNQIAYRVRSAGAIISGGAIRNIRFFSSNTTLIKTAVEVEDVSNFLIENITIQGSASGVAAFWGGGSGLGSIGVRTKGREFVRIRNLQSAADQPLVVATNPNSYISTDYFDFNGLFLLQRGVGSAGLTFESGTQIQHMSVENVSCNLGAYCVLSDDSTSTVESLGLSFRNVGSEQAEANGFTYYIRRNVKLSGLTIDGYQVWDGARGGIYLRNVEGVSLNNIWYSGAFNCFDTNATVRGLRWTASTLPNCSSATFLNQVLIRQSEKPSGYTFPRSAEYASTTDEATLHWTPYTVTASCVAGTLGGGNTFAGAYQIEGKRVNFRVSALLGAAGAGTCTQLILSLPVASYSGATYQPILGRDMTAGVALVGYTTGSGSTLTVQTYNGATVATNNLQAYLGGTYEAN